MGLRTPRRRSKAASRTDEQSRFSRLNVARRNWVSIAAYERSLTRARRISEGLNITTRRAEGAQTASPWVDGNFDGGVQSEVVTVMSVMLREPVANAPPNLGDKIEVTLLGQMSKIADQVGDGVFLHGAAALLKNRERLGGGGNVFAFIDHAPLGYAIA
jgi:hypothetical protein